MIIDLVPLVEGVVAKLDDRVATIIQELQISGDDYKLYCEGPNYMDIFRQKYHDIADVGFDCDCVQQFIKKYPEVKDKCKCDSCTKDGSKYPNCPCNPWEDTLTSDNEWYSQMKYDYVKCNLQRGLPYD